MIDFKKYKKQILAVFSVGLMIAFAAQTRFDSNNRSREVAVGHAGGDTVTNKDVERARLEWDAVKSIQYSYRNPNDPSATGGSRPLVELELLNVPGAAAMLQSNDAVYYLLQREADRMGVTVTQDEVRGLLANRLPTADERVSEAELATALENFLKVVHASERAAAAVRTSGPEVQRSLSRVQPFTANLVEFKAADYLAKVPPYSDAEKASKLEAQYKAYQAYEPTTRPMSTDGRTPQNDFAFGYRVPNEAQVQYIGVPRDAAERLVRSKITEVDAIRYYKENLADYPTTKPADPKRPRGSPPPPGVASATTRPAMAIATVFTDVPTNLPLQVAAGPLAYKDYKTTVFDELTRKRADSLVTDLLADVTAVMTADFNDLKKSAAYPTIAAATSAPSTAPTTGLANVVSSLGVPYASFEYLQKLALREQQKFELLPTIGEEKGPRSARALSDVKDIGPAALPVWFEILQKTRFDRRSMALAEIARFPTYATTMVEPLNGGTTPIAARQLRIPTIAALEASPVFNSGLGTVGGSYIFRATRAIPAHAAPQGEVAERLLADARLKDAYDLARKDAEKFAEEARKGSIYAAASAAGKKVLPTGMLDRQFTDTGAFVVSDEAAKFVFLNAAYDILQKVPTALSTDHPTGVIDVKPLATVLVGEVNGITPMWTAANISGYERGFQVELDQQERARARASWFNADDVYRRTGYQPLTPLKRNGTPLPAEDQEPSIPPVQPIG